jgi:hypothetical protein
MNNHFPCFKTNYLPNLKEMPQLSMSIFCPKNQLINYKFTVLPTFRTFNLQGSDYLTYQINKGFFFKVTLPALLNMDWGVAERCGS